MTEVHCKGEKIPRVSRCTKHIIELVQFGPILLCLCWVLSLPWSYRSSPWGVFPHQQVEKEPMLHMRAEDMYQPSLWRQWSFISLEVLLNILLRKPLDLIPGERYTNHVLRFNTCNENSELLSMIWITWGFSFENTHSICDCLFFIHIHFIC